MKICSTLTDSFKNCNDSNKTRFTTPLVYETATFRCNYILLLLLLVLCKRNTTFFLSCLNFLTIYSFPVLIVYLFKSLFNFDYFRLFVRCLMSSHVTYVKPSTPRKYTRVLGIDSGQTLSGINVISHRIFHRYPLAVCKRFFFF